MEIVDLTTYKRDKQRRMVSESLERVEAWIDYLGDDTAQNKRPRLEPVQSPQPATGTTTAMGD
jgi:hypothetical protein